MYDFYLLISAIIFISLDFLYLNIISDIFNAQIKQVQGSNIKINYYGAGLCYILLIMSLNYFIIAPRRSYQDAFLLGLVIYGVYETTNLTLFTNWSLLTVIIDTLWGGVLFATTTYIVNRLQGL